jgi:hypothetical protein
MSATVPAGFFTVIMTAVFGPGTGEIVPLITIGWSPEYEGALVCRVMLYVAACAGKKACDNTKMSAKRLDTRRALKEGVKSSLGSLVTTSGI